MKVFYADCDQFDNARTGYFATAEEAEAAFWRENIFSDRERARVKVYVRSEDSQAVVADKVQSLLEGTSFPAVLEPVSEAEIAWIKDELVACGSEIAALPEPVDFDGDLAAALTDEAYRLFAQKHAANVRAVNIAAEIC